MTDKQVIEAMMSGSRIFVGEFRATKTDHITWRDKDSGRRLEADLIRHTVECGADTIMVNERLPDGQDITKMSWPFKKGDRVVVHVESMEVNKGFTQVRGRLERIDKA